MTRSSLLAVLFAALLLPAASRADDLAGGTGLRLESSQGLISVDWKDASLTDALRLVARVGNVNLVLDPSVQGKTITLALTDVPWQQALSLACQAHGLGFETEGNVVRVAPVQKLVAEHSQQVALRDARALAAPLTTIAFPLSWTSAAAAEAIVRKQLSPRGTTFIDARTNTLFVTDVMDSPALEGRLLSSRELPGLAAEPEAGRDVRLQLAGPVTEPIVAIRPASAARAADGGSTLTLAEGRRVDVPGAPGLRVGLERDGSRLVLVARAGRAGATLPAQGTQAFALGLASGREVLLIADAGR